MRFYVLWLFSILTFMTGPLFASVTAQETKSTLAEIEKLASSGGRITPYLSESIAEQIEKNPLGIAKLLLAKLKDRTTTDRQLAVYIWALGLTKDQTAAETIIALHRQSKSELVRDSCLLRWRQSAASQPATICFLFWTPRRTN